MKVQFVRSEENASDILIKNCPDKLCTPRISVTELWIAGGRMSMKRLLAYHDSDGTMMASASKTVASIGKTMNGNGTVMTVQSDNHVVLVPE